MARGDTVLLNGVCFGFLLLLRRNGHVSWQESGELLEGKVNRAVVFGRLQDM